MDEPFPVARGTPTSSSRLIAASSCTATSQDGAPRDRLQPLDAPPLLRTQDLDAPVCCSRNRQQVSQRPPVRRRRQTAPSWRAAAANRSIWASPRNLRANRWNSGALRRRTHRRQLDVALRRVGRCRRILESEFRGLPQGRCREHIRGPRVGRQSGRGSASSSISWIARKISSATAKVFDRRSRGSAAGRRRDPARRLDHCRRLGLVAHPGRFDWVVFHRCNSRRVTAEDPNGSGAEPILLSGFYANKAGAHVGHASWLRPPTPRQHGSPSARWTVNPVPRQRGHLRW